MINIQSELWFGSVAKIVVHQEEQVVTRYIICFYRIRLCSISVYRVRLMICQRFFRSEGNLTQNMTFSSCPTYDQISRMPSATSPA